MYEGFLGEVDANEVGASEVGASEVGANEDFLSEVYANTVDTNDIDTDITGASLCSIYASKPQELNNKCSILSEKNCNATSCCLWLNGHSCVAGNASGPTFRTKNGKKLDINYYSYKNNLVENKT
jgi:hypothetical protein